MYDLLSDVRVVEVASFIAAPSCTLHLRQMGAEVIRCDAIGGGPDFHRWPLGPDGHSLYWEGLNKDKKSVALNLASEAGRELAVNLATTVGRLVTNLPERGFLAHTRLEARRPDMLTVRVMGWSDGEGALDYTVNAAVGLPFITGPTDSSSTPVNHVLPAWDIAAGLYAAFALLAADRRRAATGAGGEVRVPLGDVAIASLGALGQIAESTALGHDRPCFGNDLFGAFGRDFETGDGRRIMIAAISERQWTGLLKALKLEAAVSGLQTELGVSFLNDEGLRFIHRDRLNPLVAAAVKRMTLEEAASAFQAASVTWGPYQTLSDALASDPRLGAANPLLTPVDHVSGLTYLTPGAMGTLPQSTRWPPGRAPRLGEHSEEVLTGVLGLSTTQFAKLVDQGLVAVAPSRPGEAV